MHFDLIDDLRHNSVNRSNGELAWKLISDFVRCLLVIGIWTACRLNTGEKPEE